MKTTSIVGRGIRGLTAAVGFSAAFGVLSIQSARSEDSGVDYAKKQLEIYSNPAGEWYGPTSGPPLAKNKSIVIISSSEGVDVIHGWSEGIKKAAQDAGWKATVIDGRNSPQGWREAMTQAIALKPDGIVHNAEDVEGLQDLMAQAEAQGIKQVGIHATGTPGPHPDKHLFFNIQQDPEQIGQAELDFIIAKSNGTARVVLIIHSEYAIAAIKYKGMTEELAKCTGCKLLETADYPWAEAQQRAGQNAVGWVQKYGLPLYINATSDVDGTYSVPGLRTAGVDPTKVTVVTADGQKDAYETVRAGDEFWGATVAEPLEEEGYHAVDELNRAFNGVPPSGYIEKPYIVMHENVDKAGGDHNMYIPQNDYVGHYHKAWGLSG
jgi:ribose transport system substrate-binding protein